MSESPFRRLRHITARQPGLPSERDWERSALLEPCPAPRQPDWISDGGGLPFSPGALAGPPGRLDPEDPAVLALLAQLTARATPRRPPRAPWRRDASSAAPPPPSALGGWRLLARTEDEGLFGRGRPPQLRTVAVRKDARRRSWTCVAESAARPLRATRDGIRASSWRLDPTRETDPGDTVLRVLLTEQTFSGAQRADGRILTPDISIEPDELVLTMFVTPKPGFQARSPNPETPVRVALPHPLGARRLIDGALYDASVQDTIAGGS